MEPHLNICIPCLINILFQFVTSTVNNLLSVVAIYIKIHNKLWVTLNQVQHYPPNPNPNPTY